MHDTWKRTAVAGGLLCGAGELALSPTMDGASGAAAAIVMGLLFIGGVAWLRRGRVAGAWLIAVLAAIELAFMPMYPRSGVWDWASQGTFAVASLVALVGALGVIAQSRRRKRTSPSVAV